jgi:hypothetical protein
MATEERELLCSNMHIYNFSINICIYGTESFSPQRKSKTNISGPVRSQMSLGRTHYSVVNSTQNEMSLVKKDQRTHEYECFALEHEHFVNADVGHFLSKMG